MSTEIDRKIEKFSQTYKRILSDSLGKNTPFEKLAKNLNRQYDNMEIDAEKRALYISQALAALSQGIIHTSQNSAIELVLKSEQLENQLKLSSLQIEKQKQEIEKLLPLQIKNTKIQGEVSEKEKERVEAQKNLLEAQKVSIEEQTKDNRKIKAIQVLGDTFGTQAAGGLTVHADMWGSFFDLINKLTPISIPASTAVTKV